MDLLPHINDEVRHDLRVQLTRTLREQLRPSRESDSDRPESWSRSWQVSVLVAITDEDPKFKKGAPVEKMKAVLDEFASTFA